MKVEKFSTLVQSLHLVHRKFRIKLNEDFEYMLYTLSIIITDEVKIVVQAKIRDFSESPQKNMLFTSWHVHFVKYMLRYSYDLCNLYMPNGLPTSRSKRSRFIMQ